MQENLTPREQEILNMLLDGMIPKEIACALKVAYTTVVFHQKNMYRKLGVQNVNELLIHFLQESPAQNPVDTGGGIPAVFDRWSTFNDDLGSSISVITKNEEIKGQPVLCCNISGTMSTDNFSYAGVVAVPNPATLEAMKTMTSFSFAFLGDGNIYEVMIATSDTRTKGGLNHYRKKFTTVKDKISELVVKPDEFAQAAHASGLLLFGSPVDFIRNNAEAFQFQLFSNGTFKLKVWDIRFYK